MGKVDMVLVAAMVMLTGRGWAGAMAVTGGGRAGKLTVHRILQESLVVTTSFAAAGDISDFGPRRRLSIARTIAIEADIDQGDVTVMITPSSVLLTVEINVKPKGDLTASAVGAMVVNALADRFTSTTVLSSFLGTDVSSVIAITQLPSVSVKPEEVLGEDDGNSRRARLIVIMLIVFVIFLCGVNTCLFVWRTGILDQARHGNKVETPSPRVAAPKVITGPVATKPVNAWQKSLKSLRETGYDDSLDNPYGGWAATRTEKQTNVVELSASKGMETVAEGDGAEGAGAEADAAEGGGVANGYGAKGGGVAGTQYSTTSIHAYADAIKTLFHKLDINGDGGLDMSELRFVVQKFSG